MRIALDAMAGDKGPGVNVEGAIQAARELDLELVLVGKESVIKRELARYETRGLKISLSPAAEVIEMHESPIAAIRKKKDASILKAIQLLREKQVDAVVSAGNTGATVAAGKIYLETIPGVDRPAIVTLMPALSGPTVFLDVGANVDSRAKNLYQFAVMGSIYAKSILGKTNPRVGILSIGHEELKGNELTREAACLLKDSSLNFIGNVEGGDIFTGEVEVIVCDGFTGNVVLKVSESLAETLEESLSKEIKKSLWAKVGVFLSRRAYRHFHKKFDYAEYGGAPLLGVEGICVISHGGSSPKAIKNALKLASDFSRYRINESIRAALKE